MTIIVNPDKVTALKETRAANAIEGDKIRRLLFEINFNQENRLRVLEGKPQITKLQYRDALIALYKTLT